MWLRSSFNFMEDAKEISACSNDSKPRLAHKVKRFPIPMAAEQPGITIYVAILPDR